MSSRNAFLNLGPDALETFQPKAGKMLVKRDPSPQFVGKIAMINEDADDRRFKPTTGQVIRLGSPRRSDKTDVDIPWTVSEGDRILINQFAGHDAMIGHDDSYNIMEEADVLALIDDPNAVLL